MPDDVHLTVHMMGLANSTVGGMGANTTLVERVAMSEPWGAVVMLVDVETDGSWVPRC